ncbi:tetratricopeptide repeat protein [Shivajiella indica]|uniref:Tetratricopeptide repeat protein n=1 Tax=Shivajiella indica TaxID=872115 RepID=A0ABW5B3T0_9BACT
MRAVLLIGILCLIQFNAVAQYQKIDKQIEGALKIWESGDDLEAYLILSEIIRERPFYAEAYYYRAMVSEDAGDFQGALMDYNIQLELDPNNKEGTFARGLLRYKLQLYEQAKADFKKLLFLPKGETNTILYKRPSYQTGINKLLTQQSTQDDLIYFHLGLCSIGSGDYEDAIQSFNQALKFDQFNPDYLLNRGIAKKMAGMTQSAEEDYLLALAIDPYHPMGHQLLGELARESGNFQKAEEFYSKSIEEEPEFILPYKQRGYQRFIGGQFEEALEDFEKVISLQPNDVETLILRGDVQVKLENWESAMDDYMKVIELEPTHAKAYFGKGNVHYHNNEFLEASGAYTLAIYYQEDFGEAFYQRGISNYRLDKKNLACQDLMEAIRFGIDAAETALDKICR